MARTAKPKKVTPENKEQIAAIKNFKSSDEVADFYRFINDNKLRAEAHTLMKTILNVIAPKKTRKRKKMLQ